MAVTAGDGYSKLCDFLGLPEPKISFPCVNVGGKKKQKFIT